MKKVLRILSIVMVIILVIGVVSVNAFESKTTYQQIVQQMVNEYGVSTNTSMVQSKGVASAYCLDLTGDSQDELIVIYNPNESSDREENPIECVIYTYINDNAVKVGEIKNLSHRFEIVGYQENGRFILGYGTVFYKGNVLVWEGGKFEEKEYDGVMGADYTDKYILSSCGMNADTPIYFTIRADNLGINIYNFYGPVVVLIKGKSISTSQCLSLLEVENKEISVNVDGEKVFFDQPAIIQNGRTLVPVRAIFEKLGAKVEWDDVEKKVIGKKGEKVIKISIGSKYMTVNDEVKELDVTAQLANGRTLVPVRAISEAFGCVIDWDDESKTVYINN